MVAMFGYTADLDSVATALVTRSTDLTLFMYQYRIMIQSHVETTMIDFALLQKERAGLTVYHV